MGSRPHSSTTDCLSPPARVRSFAFRATLQVPLPNSLAGVSHPLRRHGTTRAMANWPLRGRIWRGPAQDWTTGIGRVTRNKHKTMERRFSFGLPNSKTPSYLRVFPVAQSVLIRVRRAWSKQNREIKIERSGENTSKYLVSKKSRTD